MIRAQDPALTRYFLVSGIFGLGCLMPVGLAFYLAFPDWCLMYLANPVHLPGWIMLPILVVGYAGGPPLAFLATARLMRAPRAWPLRGLVLGTLAAELFLLGFGWDRLTSVAYYDAFHHGLPTIPLLRSTLALPLGLSIWMVIGVVLGSLHHIRRHLASMDDRPSLYDTALPVRATEPAQAVPAPQDV